jgi:dipeptidyl aminopeptidase/acylaminoacyl peptidase
MIKTGIKLMAILILIASFTKAQDRMSIDLLWRLGRVNAECMSKDNSQIIYSVGLPNVAENKTRRVIYSIGIDGQGLAKWDVGEGTASSFAPLSADTYLFYQGGHWKIYNTGNKLITELKGLPEDAANVKLAPNGELIMYTSEVKIMPVSGNDFYEDLNKSNVKIYTSLNQRHWDTWEDGAYSHVFVANIINNEVFKATDIMKGQAHDCPQMPHGGAEDLIWSADSKSVIYVTKALSGTDYAKSTNTDIFQYNLTSGSTKNLSQNMPGYDTNPTLSPDGTKVAWLSMAREGYEADKNDIIIHTFETGSKANMTKDWDGTVNGFNWHDNLTIFFNAYTQGTDQLYKLNLAAAVVKQITNGDWDINGIINCLPNVTIVTRTDMNHAAEIYAVDNVTGALTQITHINDAVYKSLDLSKVEKRWITTSDKKRMLVWVIYPPGYDASKKYPTLLYCQGGPQSALSQFYSFRWNFQLMAANGYIVIAPNRRGMPGHGVKWNEQISGDWGGQSIKDYLTAVDSISTMPCVDKSRIAAVGASYGGYSVFMLAGVHQNRFKSFIAHDGVYDLRSWYGTTEEIWFSNWDMGGAYWDPKADKTFSTFNPISYINKWNTPIMIYQGGKDFRTPIEQGLQAFQAAQLKGIKSKLVYLPEENHWVLSPQNAQVWQRQFYDWLKETL